jgi:RNA polymerase sigma-70 factor (ECF subfamily)
LNTVAEYMQVDAEEGAADRLRAVAEPADMDAFLRSVERRGFLMARVALGSEADAMDVLQDTMLRLVQSYAARPAGEWRALFFRILQNCITDVRRRRKVSALLTAWRKPRGDEDEDHDPLQELPDPRDGDPARLVAGERRGAALLAALGRLPERQQQAFMLRCWEGLSTAETAQAMRCSEGSVKTHYFRALHTLRERLEEHWP